MDGESVFIDFDTVTVINLQELNLIRAKAFSTKSLLCLATSSFIAWTGNSQSSVVDSFNKILQEKKILNLPASFNQQ